MVIAIVGMSFASVDRVVVVFNMTATSAGPKMIVVMVRRISGFVCGLSVSENSIVGLWFGDLVVVRIIIRRV